MPAPWATLAASAPRLQLASDLINIGPELDDAPLQALGSVYVKVVILQKVFEYLKASRPASNDYTTTVL